MDFTQAEILQTVAMTEMEHLDVRTATLGLSLLDCAANSMTETADRARQKIERVAARLVQTVDEIGNEIGIRIANKRIAVTPISLITEGSAGSPTQVARAIDAAAATVGVDFLGGYSALVPQAATPGRTESIASVPDPRAPTTLLPSSV